MKRRDGWLQNRWPVVLGLFLLIFNGEGIAQAPQVPEARIVLFTPSDIQAPAAESYRPRLHEFGEYAEQFFHDELKSWGYAPRRKEIFDRGDDGKISVVHVTGDLKAAGGEYKKEWISRQVLGKLKSEHKVVTAGNLFWIFVYVGDPPATHNNYRGAGDSKGGGVGRSQLHEPAGKNRSRR